MNFPTTEMVFREHAGAFCQTPPLRQKKNVWLLIWRPQFRNTFSRRKSVKCGIRHFCQNWTIFMAQNTLKWTNMDFVNFRGNHKSDIKFLLDINFHQTWVFFGEKPRVCITYILLWSADFSCSTFFKFPFLKIFEKNSKIWVPRKIFGKKELQFRARKSWYVRFYQF